MSGYSIGEGVEFECANRDRSTEVGSGQMVTVRACEYCLTAYLAAANQFATPTWQPIETAPKDGTMVLTWDGRAHNIAEWKPKRNYEDDANGVDDPTHGRWEYITEDMGEDDPPTHWMPLPEPPAVTRCT